MFLVGSKTPKKFGDSHSWFESCVIHRAIKQKRYSLVTLAVSFFIPHLYHSNKRLNKRCKCQRISLPGRTRIRISDSTCVRGIICVEWSKKQKLDTSITECYNMITKVKRRFIIATPKAPVSILGSSFYFEPFSPVFLVQEAVFKQNNQHTKAIEQTPLDGLPHSCEP